MVAKPVGAATPKPRLIPQDAVNEYCRINAEIAVLTKDRDELRGTILDLFEKGYECPTSGPWVLTVTTQERCAASWKDICMAIVESLGERAKAAALKLIASMQSEKTSVRQLNTKVNPKYEVTK
jgi:hypothetical protein